MVKFILGSSASDELPTRHLLQVPFKCDDNNTTTHKYTPQVTVLKKTAVWGGGGLRD